ncbi:hypothetical protein Nepgr_022559 [Nepenthes gracilis]|uniref:Radical SAM core domain-containing protein n=1 Tax=Nepenthes gracilis TaxID=150966 RepID=A0AAD3SZ35_NEPGR|nr:hypothetical protein Nepgr_022559 [Nepenthes gracilis]
MDISCVSTTMRRAGLVVAIKPASLINHTSLPTFGKPPPTALFRLFSSFRRRLSTASTSLPAASIEIENIFDAEGDEIETKGKGLKMLLKGMRYAELEKWVHSHGFRPGQSMMLWKRLYGNNIWAHCSDEFEGLNKDFKEMLSRHAEFRALSLKDIIAASDGTRKILFTLEDGLVIETVVIPCSRGRTTVCVSSQVGCAMNCQFCYTGRMGLRRHLTAAEIVEQAVFARRLLTSEVGSITNVVFMGMGEPLHNIENVIRAVDIMVDEHGLHFSPRKVTVSTSGLVPQLKRFLRESNCALAVSLNATTDEVRSWIMPINRKYSMGLLLETLREELQFKRNYKVLFEYVMLAGVNDSMDDAKRLINLVQGIPCKINLISFNPHSGSLFKPTPEEKMIEFRNVLAEAGCIVFLRLSRGNDQMAACGQLGKPGEIRAPVLRVPDQFLSSERVEKLLKLKIRLATEKLLGLYSVVEMMNGR